MVFYGISILSFIKFKYFYSQNLNTIKKQEKHQKAHTFLVVFCFTTFIFYPDNNAP